MPANGLSDATPAATLIGRGQELGILSSFLESTEEQGRALIVSGEAGVGKTALLDAAVKGAAWLRMRVVRVAGLEFEADISFAGLNQVLVPFRAEFELLSPRYRQALDIALGFADGPAVDRLLVSNATLDLLRQVSAARRLLIVVDDLQWLDRSSAAVLLFVIRRLTGSRLDVLAAYRLGSDFVFEHGGIPELEVKALDEESSHHLVSAHFPTLAPDVRLRLLEEAEGNPLALLELPIPLSDAQRASQAALPTVLPLSRRLLSLFAIRISELPPTTRRLLLLAVLDGSGDLRVLQRRGHVNGEQHDLADLGPAESARLVQVAQSNDRLAFRHPLIRSAVVELSTSDERRRAHEFLAEVRIDDPERRVWHLTNATLAPDEEVAGLLQEMAFRILGRGDAVGAVTALTRAADLSPLPADRSRRLAEAAYLGADVTGQLHSASRLLAEARQVDQQAEQSWQAAVTTSHVLLHGEGDIDAAHRLLVQAIEARTGSFDEGDEMMIGALHTLLMICWSGGRPELWAPFHTALARFTPQAPAILTLCGYTMSDPARTPASVVGQLDHLIRELPDQYESTRIVRTGLAAIYLDRAADCREAYLRVQRDGREGGAITSAIKAMAIMSTEDFRTGRWQEAKEEAQEALEYCESHGYRLLACVAQHTLGLIAAASGDESEALSLADEMTRWAVPRGNRTVQWHANHIRLLAATGRGDFEEAYQQATSISPAGVFASHVPTALTVGFDLVEAAVRTDRRAEASDHVRAMVETGIASLSRRTALMVHSSSAAVAADDPAVELFEQALAVPGTDRWPMELARTHLAYGERLRRTRATAQARIQLAAAVDIFQRLGARPWALRATNELRATGQTRAGSVSPETALLTSREGEIATLAATGLTNKQIGERLFLSPRTVGYHLHQIFPKLGVSSRAALRDALTPSTARHADEDHPAG